MGIIRKSLVGWRNLIRYLNSKVSYLGFLVHFVATVVLAFSVFAVTSLFLIGVTTVDGSSMEPTLSENDHLLTLRFGRFFSDLLGTEYVPERGDIIVFSKEDSEKFLIKRVIGLPNELVMIKNQTVTIYNKENLNGFQPDLDLDEQFTAFDDSETANVYVKRGELFVLGDNLEVSSDSRAFGNVLIENVNGKLFVRTWPISKFTFF